MTSRSRRKRPTTAPSTPKAKPGTSARRANSWRAGGVSPLMSLYHAVGNALRGVPTFSGAVGNALRGVPLFGSPQRAIPTMLLLASLPNLASAQDFSEPARITRISDARPISADNIISEPIPAGMQQTPLRYAGNRNASVKLARSTRLTSTPLPPHSARLSLRFKRPLRRPTAAAGTRRASMVAHFRPARSVSRPAMRCSLSNTPQAMLPRIRSVIGWPSAVRGRRSSCSRRIRTRSIHRIASCRSILLPAI